MKCKSGKFYPTVYYAKKGDSYTSLAEAWDVEPLALVDINRIYVTVKFDWLSRNDLLSYPTIHSRF